MGKPINGPKKEEINQIQEKNIIAQEANGSSSNKINGEIEAENEDSEAAANGRRNADQSSTEIVQIHRWTSDQTTENAPKKVYGFENEVLSLQNLLEQRENDNNFKAIGIVGMRGVGKTTLCQQLFNSPELKKEYLPRIWISMSKKSENDNEQVTKLPTVKRLLYSLGVDGEKLIESSGTPENDKLKALLYVLHQQLMGKKYLVVLDDVRESEDDWYEDLGCCASDSVELGNRLAHGLPKGYGGRVIVTSRDEEVAKKLVGKGGKNLHRLKPFSDPVSFWSIFIAAVEEGGEKLLPQDLEKLQQQLLKKCDGVPLAAITMGKAQAESIRDRRTRKQDRVQDKKGK